MDITISHLWKNYGEKPVLSDFSALLPEGKTTCIMGPSGCGKTTLLHILLGLESADSGMIHGLPRRISAVFQENRLCEGFSAGRNATLAASRKIPQTELEAHFKEVGLFHCLHQPVSQLSGGMKRRIAILRAVLAEGELLILDEPFQGLDETTKALVISYLKKHTKGRTVLLVTHSAEEAAQIGECCIHMK